MDMSEIREMLNALIEVKQDIERQLLDINDRVCDLKTNADELLDRLTDGVGKIHKADAEVSRKMFGLYLQKGINIGTKFKIPDNPNLPQPVEVIGIDCWGFVCRLPNGNETKLLWEYADKYAGKLDVLKDEKGNEE